MKPKNLQRQQNRWRVNQRIQRIPLRKDSLRSSEKIGTREGKWIPFACACAFFEKFLLSNFPDGLWCRSPVETGLVRPGNVWVGKQPQSVRRHGIGSDDAPEVVAGEIGGSPQPIRAAGAVAHGE